jgi:hypothetical protein
MAVSPPQYDALFHRNRWVAYFDLLGISSLIKSNEYLDVFYAYAEAMREVKQDKIEEVHPVWFSDTFILYSNGDASAGFDESPFGFVALHSVARGFMHSLTLKQIPVRGAIAYGDFYADSTNELFFGNALLEAHRYGESQDWLGLILTPSAETQLKAVGLSPEEHLRGSYVRWQIPFKEHASLGKMELFACLFAECVDSPLRQFCISKIQEMKKLAESNTDSNEKPRIVAKYDRTLAFLNGNIHRIVQKP